MAIFKCKMCGGSLNIEDKQSIVTCEYCGTQQTLPKLDDDRRANMYDRANHFRRNSEFDMAMGIYEQILSEDNSDSEAYWSLVLCRYGIEYVEDPATKKRIPTINRAQFTSILEDEDYKSALEKADADRRAIYEREATVINDIQKRILDISQKEDPFDVFICYKETDGMGERTIDSVIAQDIYYQLTKENLKVFFARITLEDKLGSAYEPYIFAALNSAKVMIVVGSKPEHFNAPWVRNEWSRYLSIVNQSRGEKLLIPAYKGMDPYSLPREFAHLQAQDMDKIGFMQDLVRGIKKLTGKNETKAVPKQATTANSSTNTNIAPMLERASMFLEDGEWQSADEYCEKILDLDPKNGRAYLGKLMAELKVKQIEELANLKEPFDNNKLYEKVIRFSDEKTRKTIEDCINNIKINKKNAQNENLYNQALGDMIKAKTEEEYKKAAKLFNPIIGYKDADKRIEECLEKAEFARKDNILFTAKRGLSSSKDVATIEDAIKSLESIRDWKDAEEQIILGREILNQKIENLKRLEEAQKIHAKTRKIVVAVLIPVAIFLIILFTIVIPGNNYKKMKELIDDEKYTEAYVICKDLNGYKDCEELLLELQDLIMKEAEELYLDGNAGKAADLIDHAGIYYPAYRYVADGNYRSAISSGLTQIVLPDSVTRIGEKAFSDCDSLTSIVIPDSVTSIGDLAFYSCKSLTSVEIGNSVTSIGDYAFYNCTSLTSVEIGNSVTSIGEKAFSGCDSLTSIVIPDSVTSIGDYAFSWCTSLTSIVIPDSVTNIGDYAFYNCTSLTSIEVDADNQYYKSIDGNLYSKDGKSLILIQYAIGKTDTSFKVPSDVTSIGDGAFSYCTSLTSIVIPDNITSIGNWAFSYCTSLTSIVIPDSVTSIGDWAFSDCDSLTSIVIPDSVTSIGDGAFYNCYSLTDVYYTGSKSEWEAIYIGTDNYPLTSATIHYNYVANN